VIAPRRRQATRRPRIVVVLMVVGLVVAAGLLAVGPARRLLSGCAFAGNRCIRVLFIGNSYTSVNDLPATFAELASSGGVAVEVDAIDPGGQTLAGHAAAPDVLAAITGRRWTTVVLQEQSEIPAATDLFDRETVPAATTLVAAGRLAPNPSCSTPGLIATGGRSACSIAPPCRRPSTARTRAWPPHSMSGWWRSGRPGRGRRQWLRRSCSGRPTDRIRRSRARTSPRACFTER